MKSLPTTTCGLPEPRSGGAGAEPLPSSASADASSLEQPQTSSEEEELALARKVASDDNPDYCPFVHSGWKRTRRLVGQCIAEAGGGATRVLRFLQCGEEVWEYENMATGERQYRHNHCGDRFCLVCGACRSARIRDALEAKIADIKPLFMTFTVRGRPGDSLRLLIGRVAGAFAAVRETPLWKRCIKGGVALLEVKHSATGGGHWHPHFHVIADGRYIEVGWLSQLWKTLTGGSSQVHVSRVEQKDVALRYVCKYASKPMDSSFIKTPKLLIEAMLGLKGKRLAACFGSWYRTPLFEELDDEEAPIFTEWRCVGSSRGLGVAAAAGDAAAAVVLARMERHFKLFGLRFDDG